MSYERFRVPQGTSRGFKGVSGALQEVSVAFLGFQGALESPAMFQGVPVGLREDSGSPMECQKVSGGLWGTFYYLKTPEIS